MTSPTPALAAVGATALMWCSETLASLRRKIETLRFAKAH